MVVHHINSVLRQALQTFSNGEAFTSNLELLSKLLKNTAASDINLHPKFKSEELWSLPGKAPLTYIDIFENDVVTMGVFIMRPGMKIPLHDHPKMYGMVKVLMGQIKITSFTVQEVHNLHPLVISAEKEPDILLDSNSDVCMLDPKHGNIHEIESVNGPAAFFDILSPPYSRGYDSADRKCTYFTVKENVSDSLYSLRQIKAPNWFWNDNYRYEGPKLMYERKNKYT